MASETKKSGHIAGRTWDILDGRLQMQSADLIWASLSEASLSMADMKGADLRGAALRRADLKVADMKGANLSGADLGGADMKGADLNRADLSGADMKGADLKGAYLKEVDLRGADLTGANLKTTFLFGANLSNCRGVYELDMTDPRGYRPIAVAHADGWRIAAGCRWFTVPEALAHWAEAQHEYAARYTRAINELPPCS